MCLVEVEKAPKLTDRLQTQVADGMVVHTASEKVKEAQQAVMEFLLINHPLDCPICDQAGECGLQDQDIELRHGRQPLHRGQAGAGSKAVDIGPHVMLDQERCIHCSRCVRFCDEVTRTGELGFFKRGERIEIGISPGSGWTTPTRQRRGHLPGGRPDAQEFRFQKRVWFLKNTPSICAGCARGCNVMVAVGTQQELMTSSGQFDDRIKRIVPRVNMDVNGYWMCDEGRLSYQRLDAAPRDGRREMPAGHGRATGTRPSAAPPTAEEGREAGRARRSSRRG